MDKSVTSSGSGQSDSVNGSGQEPHPDEAGAAQLMMALSPKQRVALDALLVPGTTVPDAAEKAGVHRGTVSRWLHCDENFIAAFNARLLEQITLANAQMLALVPRAIKAIEYKLNGGDGRIGIQVIKSVTDLARHAPLISASVIAQERKVAELEKQLALERQKVEAEEQRELVVARQKEIEALERKRLREQIPFEQRYEEECREFHMSRAESKAREIRKDQINERVAAEVKRTVAGLMNPGTRQGQPPLKSPEAAAGTNPGTTAESRSKDVDQKLSKS